MIVKLIWVSLLLFITAEWKSAEFWIVPSKFYVPAGESVYLGFKVGDSFIGQTADIKKADVVKMEKRFGQQVDDLKPQLQEGLDKNFYADLKEEGSHVFSFQSSPLVRKYEAEDFSAYLRDYALDDAANYRRKNQQIDQPAYEQYVNYAKLIVQSGKKTDDNFKKPVGMPLEIIIQENPASLKVGSKVSFKILWQGKPLFGARVNVWNRFNNRITTQPIFSQMDGVIETHIMNSGPWMVSVVKMIHQQNSEVEWMSYCSTLTFGVQ